MHILNRRVTRFVIFFNYKAVSIRPRYLSASSSKVVGYLMKYLNVPLEKAEYILLRHPAIDKLNENKILSVINTLHDLGLGKSVLSEDPVLFSVLPVTLKYRFKILEECGFHKVDASLLASYLFTVKRKTILELKNEGFIPNNLVVENRLAGFFTQWPSSLSALAQDDSRSTLQDVRMRILQRYLELVLDLSEDDFHKRIKTYVRIKHRPLQTINETLTLLQSYIMMSSNKIRSNLFLIHSDPENIKLLVYKFRSIGGVDMKEILRMHPKLCNTSYTTMIATQKILLDYGIPNELQVRCFEIYTLGPETIRQRLEEAKSIPEFQALYQHPRFLKIIHYKSTAVERMSSLYKINKKCLSLNILSGSSAHYRAYEKGPGDRTKGKDLIFGITQQFGPNISSSDVRNILKRHPFWINIPLVHAKSIYEKLSTNFTYLDIYENCPILLYPWNKIEEILNKLSNTNKRSPTAGLDQLDLTRLTKSQILSLVLYMLDKEHYFSGNGVWTEEKLKSEIYTLSNEQVKSAEI